jgi:hypothetical protein
LTMGFILKNKQHIIVVAVVRTYRRKSKTILIGGGSVLLLLLLLWKSGQRWKIKPSASSVQRKNPDLFFIISMMVALPIWNSINIYIYIYKFDTDFNFRGGRKHSPTFSILQFSIYRERAHYYEMAENLGKFQNFRSGHSHATTTPQPGQLFLAYHYSKLIEASKKIYQASTRESLIDAKNHKSCKISMQKTTQCSCAPMDQTDAQRH